MGKKKRVHVPSSEPEEGGEEETFVVEVIKAAKVQNHSWVYRVKWADYDSDSDTWEPYRNLTNCKRLLDSFWANVGMDNKDYFEGHEVKATPSWIKREKKLFADQLRIAQPESESEADEGQPSSSQLRIEPRIKKKPKEDAPVIKRKRGRPPKVKTTQKTRAVVASDSDERPLSTIRSKGKKRANAILSEESEDGSQPASKVSKPKVTIKIPIPRQNKDEGDYRPEASEGSSDAGSLFSGDDGDEESSPEVALGSGLPHAGPSGSGATVPTKRPSVDEAAATAPRKRQAMEMPMPITETSGNATKARLAGRAPPPPLKAPLSAFHISKTSRVASAPSDIQTQSAATQLQSKYPLPRRSTSTSDHGQSPAPGGSAGGTPTLQPSSPAFMAMPPPSIEPTRSIPLPRGLSNRQPATIPSPLADAERFLAENMPSAMASPMQEDATTAMRRPPAPPIRTAPIKPSALPRIPKKWKWSGDLFIDVSRDRAERVCEILLSEATEPLPEGLRFSICLSGDSIRLSAFHDLGSLPLFLLASARVQQFAKLNPLEAKDAEAVNAIGAYMKKKSLFTFTHLYNAETSVGLLIVYPTGHAIPTDFLKVPSTLATDTPLQVALLPWELTAKELRLVTWKARKPTEERILDPSLVRVLDSVDKRITKERRYYQGVHILGFSKALHDYFSTSVRPYCIWGDVSPGVPQHTGYETSLLRALLSDYKATDAGFRSPELRMTLVHVGGLASLHHMPDLAERRMRTAVRFMTYGTHPSVPRERWGFWEIFPIGGIVTFTPSAIIQNHSLMFKLVREIAEHSTWECYVLPSVVAMVAKLTCQGQHPLRVYDEGNFVYDELLNLIERGSLSLLHAPQAVRNPPKDSDPAALWTRWMLRVPRMDARMILEECIKLAAEEFANTSEADLPVSVEKEIARDLCRMQVQPAIMDNYRRFVVIRARSDVYLAKNMKGFECTTLSDFRFRDDFYEESRRASPEKK